MLTNSLTPVVMDMKFYQKTAITKRNTNCIPSENTVLDKLYRLLSQTYVRFLSFT